VIRRDQVHSDSQEKQWELTFTDMLTLLLTFFIFIIAVSVFKTSEYKLFWENFAGKNPGTGLKEKKPARQSAKFALIKSLKLPWLGPEAEKMLSHLEDAFSMTDFDGIDVDYDENKISLAISDQLNFGEGQSRLNEKIKPLLLKFIPILQASPFNIAVEGHADVRSIGKNENIELSLNRALATARFLIQNGLDKNKVSVSGYGPYRSLEDKKLPGEQQLNCRVEINIIINND
jgi:chemotaxis protein MotB